jgi:hypothetical protein
MCFVAGTLVLTSDGPQAIETIKPGTLVLARDQFGSATDWKPVLETFVSRTRSLVQLKVRKQDGTDDLLEVTPNHPFFAEGRGWVEAATLIPGQDLLFDHRGERVEIVSAESVAAKVLVYNLEVADYHTYFAGRIGVWAHNFGDGPCSNVPPSIQSVMSQGNAIQFPDYRPGPSMLGPNTGGPIAAPNAGGLPPEQRPFERPAFTPPPTPYFTPPTTPYFTPPTTPAQSVVSLLGPAPPPIQYPAPGPVSELQAGTEVYHATSFEAFRNIFQHGLRPNVENAYGGGQLGPGFYTTPTSGGASNYMPAGGGQILVFTVNQNSSGPVVWDMFEGPGRIGRPPLGHAIYDSDFLTLEGDNPVSQYKWNHGAYGKLTLTHVIDATGTRYEAEDWYAIVAVE